jgi:hypothetical protein
MMPAAFGLSGAVAEAKGSDAVVAPPGRTDNAFPGGALRKTTRAEPVGCAPLRPSRAGRGAQPPNTGAAVRWDPRSPARRLTRRAARSPRHCGHNPGASRPNERLRPSEWSGRIPPAETKDSIRSATAAREEAQVRHPRGPSPGLHDERHHGTRGGCSPAIIVGRGSGRHVAITRHGEVIPVACRREFPRRCVLDAPRVA